MWIVTGRERERVQETRTNHVGHVTRVMCPGRRLALLSTFVSLKNFFGGFSDSGRKHYTTRDFRSCGQDGFIADRGTGQHPIE